MKATIIVAMLVLALALIVGCEQQPPSAPQESGASHSFGSGQEASMALELVSLGGWALDEEAAKVVASQQPLSKGSGAAMILESTRQPIANGVVHYSFRLRIGPGRYDVIGIHRVVREEKPNRPIQTGANIFMIHGDYKNFEGCFLPGLLSGRKADDFGFAVYLAMNNVDVWGIDQAWTLVPSSETNFSFMSNWGMQRMVNELNVAVAVANLTRCLTGNGSSGMLLSGYSSGSTTGFALLNQETRLPAMFRNVMGFIPVDQGVITNIPEWEAAMCGAVANYRDLMNSGQYQDNNPLLAFGMPALQDPAGASGLIPGFTNLQAALALGVSPFFAGVSSHFLAGTFDAEGTPTGLQYSNVADWIDFMVAAPPYEPLAYERDEYITSCPQAGGVPWDDHLADIRVPILYVMAGGGFGYTGEYTLHALGSTDITRLRVSLQPPTKAELDFGHIDLFLANNAQALVWQPILTWIKNHTRTNHHVGS